MQPSGKGPNTLPAVRLHAGCQHAGFPPSSTLLQSRHGPRDKPAAARAAPLASPAPGSRWPCLRPWGCCPRPAAWSPASPRWRHPSPGSGCRQASRQSQGGQGVHRTLRQQLAKGVIQRCGCSWLTTTRACPGLRAMPAAAATGCQRGCWAYCPGRCCPAHPPSTISSMASSTRSRFSSTVFFSTAFLRGGWGRQRPSRPVGRTWKWRQGQGLKN